MANPTKLVRWLPQIVEATADEIKRFGPQTARVRALLKFLPTMSDDAARVSGVAARAESNAASNAAWNAARDAARYDAWEAARDAAWNTARNMTSNSAWGAAGRAAAGEVVSDLIDPTSYRVLTNPIATGRAFDVLRPRAPEGFKALTRDLTERRLLTQPADMVASSRFARLPQKERDALMEALLALAPEGGLADSGFDSLQDIIDAARLLG